MSDVYYPEWVARAGHWDFAAVDRARILDGTRISTYSHGTGPNRYTKTTATHHPSGVTVTRENTATIVVENEIVRLVQEKERDDQAKI